MTTSATALPEKQPEAAPPPAVQRGVRFIGQGGHVPLDSAAVIAVPPDAVALGTWDAAARDEGRAAALKTLDDAKADVLQSPDAGQVVKLRERLAAVKTRIEEDTAAVAAAEGQHSAAIARGDDPTALWRKLEAAKSALAGTRQWREQVVGQLEQAERSHNAALTAAVDAARAEARQRAIEEGERIEQEIAHLLRPLLRRRTVNVATLETLRPS